MNFNFYFIKLRMFPIVIFTAVIFANLLELNESVQ